jgi:hypothetical protein
METVEIGLFKCTQPDCSIHITGKCVNGLPGTECSNMVQLVENVEISEEEEEEDGNMTGRKIKDTIRLNWGDNFDDIGISKITYRHQCKLILLVGEPSSGKSTLYAALFDSFHKGGCGSFIFSGTRTPIGFERICHLAREKSKGKVPKTERTKAYEFAYMHLAVRNKNLQSPITHLLFADVNGERFQAAKDSDEEMLRLSVMKRAHHIFFIADGNLLTDNREKHAVKRDLWKLLDRAIQNNMISTRQGISLVVTKADEINAAGKTNEITDFFITPSLERYKGSIERVIQVASRSLNDAVPPRTGVDEFLAACLAGPNLETNFKVSIEIKREFQRFKYENNDR